MLLQAPFIGRHNFPKCDVAVEVGTHRGAFARCIRCNKLCCVDHWLAGYCSGDPASERPQSQRESDMAEAAVAVPHATLLRLSSAEAAATFADTSVDFVYIDADHTRIAEDIALWLPKCRGLLAGHDFLCPNEADGGWGKWVQPAVLALPYDVYLVLEHDNSPWSWYCDIRRSSC